MMGGVWPFHVAKMSGETGRVRVFFDDESSDVWECLGSFGDAGLIGFCVSILSNQ
jgi:hypothetical protein